MEPVRIFNSINPIVPWNKIYRRLGYRQSTTTLTERERKKIDGHIDYALSLLALRGAGRRLFVDNSGPSRIVLPDERVFTSSNLSTFIGNCREILLIGATGGSGITEAIAEDARRNNLTRGVVLDAVASEMVDAALDWLQNYFTGLLRREDRFLMKRRFSAGYGDFDLTNQGIMYDMLDLKKIGVRITEHFILIPEKSVTAVTGISETQRR